MSMSLPILYKINSRGKKQQWRIYTTPNSYVVEYGQEGGKFQSSEVVVPTGKNIGKANETTVSEQVELEAKSLWVKQVDKGYSETTSQKQKESFIRPMLAQSYDKHAKKIVFPCYGQPKSDGCRALFIGGRLYSRKGKEFTSCPHIVEEANKLRLDIDNLILDGELYNHQDNFQDLISYIRREESSKETEAIEFHVYDCFYSGEKLTFEERLAILTKVSQNFKKYIKLVDTFEIKNDLEIDSYHDNMIGSGYEGLMLRNKNGVYLMDKRSYDLQKVKSFTDGEFEIVGFERNKGRQSNQCTIICKTAEGKEFGAKPVGDEVKREWYLDNIQSLIGKMATVKYFELSEDNIPRFPILLEVRSYE